MSPLRCSEVLDRTSMCYLLESYLSLFAVRFTIAVIPRCVIYQNIGDAKLSDPSETNCSNCSKLWEKVEELERGKAKAEKNSAYLLLASGILLGMNLAKLIMSLLSISW